VFELAQQDSQVDEWRQRLAKVRDLLSNPQVAAVLNNPTIATEQRQGLVASARLFDDETSNLARLLIESGRVGDAQEIEDEFERLTDEVAGRVRATVTTAIELGPHDRDRIANELSRRLNKEVKLQVAVDPRILGGLRLQYGDHIVDASVATKLQQLRRRLAAT
jgi:F-type H+-transporting ATPase subunit delta